MATVAGSVLAGYVALGVEMKYLIAASFMAAPGGFLMAKMMMPEVEEVTVNDDEVIQAEHDQYVNVIDAAAGGATSGMQLAVNIGAMLIAFVALNAINSFKTSFCPIRLPAMPLSDHGTPIR